MHKIQAKQFEPSDFSIEHLTSNNYYAVFGTIIDALNTARNNFNQSHTKTDWWQMIQLLPSSYNQKRTIMLNYEVLHNMYISRKHHKLDEWRIFCDWIEQLPYSDVITQEEKTDANLE